MCLKQPPKRHEFFWPFSSAYSLVTILAIARSFKHFFGQTKGVLVTMFITHIILITHLIFS